MNPRRYDALVLDLDGTLVGGDELIHPYSRRALITAAERGVQIMIATGRSEAATWPILRELGLTNPAIVYNGAALACPVAKTLIEVRTLGKRAIEEALGFADRAGVLGVVMVPGGKYAREPSSPSQRDACRGFWGLTTVPPHDLRRPDTVRISLLSERHDSSAEFAREVAGILTEPAFITHFPLRLLPKFRQSPLMVVDVQPQCDGKAEALRVLADRHGIGPERTVAVGDADNDRLLIERAGLGVAMANAEPEIRHVADRVIGHCNTDTLGRLVEELFLE